MHSAMATSRRIITQALTIACQSYWLHKGFSCFSEIALTAWGGKRADMVAVNMRTELVICEIKSSVADYTTDKKWRDYLPFCHSLFFVLTEDVWLKLKERMAEDGVFESGAGVLILDRLTGYLKCVKWCKRRPMEGTNQRTMTTRLAWRNGVSKRTDTRVRQYIDLENGTVYSTPKTAINNLPTGISQEIEQLLDDRKSRKSRKRRRRKSRKKNHGTQL